MKYFSIGADGRYQLSLRVEFYNLFNRHYYSIHGCGGVGTNVGDGNFAAVTGVQTIRAPASSACVSLSESRPLPRGNSWCSELPRFSR